MRTPKLTILTTVLLLSTCFANAAQLADLDRVSVLMAKPAVVTILGQPDTLTDLGGLAVELYLVHQAEPLVSVGYFYEENQILAGYSLIFRGDVIAETAARLKSHGFKTVEQHTDYLRLQGNDDDTGHPIVVTISRLDTLTTVTTFEQGFYQRRAANQP